MRDIKEIKFRAWDKIDKDIKEVALISFVDRGVLLWTNAKNTRATVERDFSDIELIQWTGLKDENGVEINEGHIVEVEDDRDVYRFLAGATREIWFNDGGFRLRPPKRYVGQRGHWLESDVCLKVVGNIFENPELVEED